MLLNFGFHLQCCYYSSLRDKCFLDLGDVARRIWLSNPALRVLNVQDKCPIRLYCVVVAVLAFRLSLRVQSSFDLPLINCNVTHS